MTTIRLEVWLTASYAVFLLAVAAILERLALHCHRRSHRIGMAGFAYRHELDAWECPARQFLTRAALTPGRTPLVIYRAPARVCNGCALKPGCAPSDGGREIVAPPHNWLQSQIGRFHRGLSLSLCVLAAFLLAVEIFRSHAAVERFLLLSMLALITLLGKRLATDLRTVL